MGVTCLSPEVPLTDAGDLTTNDARRLTEVLVGGPGVEVMIVRGQLEVARENRITLRIRTPVEDLTAEAPAEMRDLIRDLLLTEVTATVSIEMRTSPTTGAPSQRSTVLALAAAS
jgi:hypothetical protein